MKRYFCDQCNKETDLVKKNLSETIEYPKSWITLKEGIIVNDIPNSNLEYSGGYEINLCSKKCFIDYFFKPE